MMNYRLMSSAIIAATLFGCGRPDPARPVEWKVPAIRYETGKEIIYSGKVGRSKFGGYAIQNLNVLPIAVHLQDTQDSSAFTVGETVAVRGILRRKTIGSDDPKSQVLKQDLFFMAEYKVLKQNNGFE
jgi:hypothetical protein